MLCVTPCVCVSVCVCEHVCVRERESVSVRIRKTKKLYKKCKKLQQHSYEKYRTWALKVHCKQVFNNLRQLLLFVFLFSKTTCPPWSPSGLVPCAPSLLSNFPTFKWVTSGSANDHFHYSKSMNETIP